MTVARIAVLRCNALGDYLMATPALAALRERFPRARITLVGANWQARFLTGRPGPVDEVAVLPRVDRLAGQPPVAPPAARLPAFLEGLRARRLDLALQLHGGGAASNPLVTAFGADLAVGLRADGAPPLDRYVPYRHYQPEASRLLEVTSLVGADGRPEYPRLAVLDSEREQAAALLGGAGPWVAMHPGASDPRRRWPADRFGELVRYARAVGARPVLVGGPHERDLAVAVQATAGPGDLVDLTGTTGIGTLGAVLARCAAVVGDDSGPLHLARAVGTPTVGLFWCGNAISAASTRRARDRVLVSWTAHCPRCGADCTPAGNRHRPGDGCAHRDSFLTQIPAAEAAAELDDLLSARQPLTSVSACALPTS